MALAIAALTFSACEDVPEPYPTPTIGPKAEVTYEGNGTLESPYTVADAINYAKSFNQAESDKEVYIKGYITAITEEYTTNFGNGTFVMSDAKEGGNTFTFYRGLYLGNQRYTSGKTQIKVGDEVIVYGKVVNYRGNTPETVQGSAFLYSLNGVTEGGGDEPAGEAKGTGTLDDPFNAAAAIAYAKEVGDQESDKDVYIKGKVASITEQYGTQFGNATFAVSDDGTTAGAFTIYRALYLGNKKYTAGDLLKEGDDVIIFGKVTNFKGNTPETVQGKAYLYSLNGKTEGGGGGGGDTPSGDAKGSGTESDPYNAIAAIKYVQGLGADVESEKDIYVTGIISSIKYTYSSQYGTATYSISADGKTANEFTVYGSYYLNNQPWKDGDTQIQVGDEVVVCGKVVNYGGNTPEFANKKNWLVSIKSNGSGGGDTPGGGQGGEVSGNTITVAASSFGLENQAKLNTLTLTDGTTLTFNGGGNSNTPAFYTAGNGTIRMYPKNSFTINAGSKKIAAIEIVCNEYSGTLYNASGNITVEGNKMTVDGSSLKASGINASSATVSNTSEGSGASTQLRMETLKITYAE